LTADLQTEHRKKEITEVQKNNKNDPEKTKLGA